MSLEDITIENSVETWGILDILGSVMFTFVCAMFGIVSLVATIYYPNESPTNDVYFTIVWLSIITYMVLMFFRNRIIKKIFMKTAPNKFLEFTYVLDRIMKVLVVILLLALFLIAVVPIEIYDAFRFFFLIFSLFLLYTPFFMFTKAITDSGEIRIAFKELFSTLHNFDRRQKWLGKIFGKLRDNLKKGNIKVSRDKLVYHCNLKLMNPEDMTKHLIEIERWMLGEPIRDIVNSINKIIPQEEIKPIERASVLDRFFQIPSDIRKYIFLAIILVIFMALKPELVEKLINEFLK
jgi:hypothetical protein